MAVVTGPKADRVNSTETQGSPDAEGGGGPFFYRKETK